MLPIIADTYPLEIALESRFIKFFKSVMNSENELVAYRANRFKNNSNSTLGHNLRHLVTKYDMTVDDFSIMYIGKIKNILHTKWALNLGDDYIHSAIMVREIRLLPGFNDEEQIVFLNIFLV